MRKLVRKFEKAAQNDKTGLLAAELKEKKARLNLIEIRLKINKNRQKTNKKRILKAKGN